MRLRLLDRKAEAARRRQSFPVRGEEPKQLKFLAGREQRAFLDRPRSTLRPRGEGCHYVLALSFYLWRVGAGEE